MDEREKIVNDVLEKVKQWLDIRSRYLLTSGLDPVVVSQDVDYVSVHTILSA